MSDLFSEYMKTGKRFFDQRLPFWCSDFSRPTDQLFGEYLIRNGLKVQYFIMEEWDQVYVPVDCDLEVVKATAVRRRLLRERGVSEALWPVLL